MPAPRFGLGRRAHDGKEIKFFVVSRVVVVQLASRLIGLHDISAQLIPLGTQCLLHEVKGKFSLSPIELLDADSLSSKETVVDIGPATPFIVVDRKCRFLSLLLRQRSQEFLGCQSCLFGGCLLYTSPSPRDKRQSRMPSSA